MTEQIRSKAAIIAMKEIGNECLSQDELDLIRDDPEARRIFLETLAKAFPEE